MTQKHSVWNAAVIVAALGYFVDIYDLVLFSTVRMQSLQALGIAGEALTDTGLMLINAQMFGMLIGGVVWGIFGDKKGRLAVLFGSIALYSLANIANGMVQSVTQYAVLRFIAGIGLAGELGAGITLVAEVLPKEKRGLGTTIVASVGVCGAVLAGFIAENYDWRVAYYIGGVLGIALLILRVKVFESGMYEKATKHAHVSRGDFFSLFSSRARFFKYVRCIAIGLPTWFVIGILITFAPEFARTMGVEGTITGSRAIMFSYAGLAIGDLLSGLLSQFLRSRKKVVGFFMALTLIFTVLYLNQGGVSESRFYAMCLALGFGVGFWAIFVTVAAEQFGTNLRATVATTAPNFVRGALIPITFLFTLAKAEWGLIYGAQAIGFLCVFISLFCLWGLEETFHKELDYFEL